MRGYAERVLVTVAGVLGVAGLAGGCGPRGTTVVTPAVAPATPPGPASQLVAVLDRPLGTVSNTLRLVDSAANVAATVPVPADAEAMSAAGEHVLIAGGGRLSVIGRNGSVQQLASIPDDTATDTIAGFIASPDGHRWLWTSVSQSPDGVAHSRLHLGGDGIATTLLADRFATGRVLRPVAWTRGGPVVADEPLGIGGYILFRREFGPTMLVDTSSGALRPLTGADCALSDLSSDGTVACVREGREGPNHSGTVTLRVIGPDGRARDVSLPLGTAQAGAAFFSADAGRLSLARSPALGDGPVSIETDTVDVASGTRQRLGPAGLTPCGWLADGRLLETRSTGTAGGDPGTYAVAADGSALQLAGGSTVVGLLG